MWLKGFQKHPFSRIFELDEILFWDHAFHAFFDRSFAHGVGGLDETQEKKGIHCLRFPEHLQKANSMQEFCKNKKRLQALSEPNSNILHQQHTNNNN